MPISTQRILRAWRLILGRRLAGQDIARANAAEASATLRQRRREHEDVDAYLRAWHSTDARDVEGARQWSR